MIGIKKVEVTPLDYNEGKIIDSTNTTDNIHTNTYSINAIKQYVGNTSYTKAETNDLVDDLDNTKVDKAGDTLTGSLNFQNTDSFDAIEKTRTIEGTAHKIKVGVGSEGSSVIENWTGSQNVGRLEIKSNGEIWNAISNSKVVERGDFAVLTGTLNSGSATINYPTGFTKDNCVVISTMLTNPNNSNTGIGSTFDSTNLIRGTVPLSVEFTSSNIVIYTKNIGLSNGNTAAVSDVSLGLSYKIVLMKIS